MGRLIDADALLICIPYEDVTSRMAVANAPTIEPERKRGEWKVVVIGHFADAPISAYRCTSCNTENWTRSKYCPNCGARMER